MYRRYLTSRLAIHAVVMLSILFGAAAAEGQDTYGILITSDNAESDEYVDEVNGGEIDPDTLADLDITALMDIEVVSVTGKSESWFNTPAALSVITPEDIERGGFQLLPEALRMVPGVNVGRLSASQWAVGVRGFNSLFANKLQVSVDGRSAYNLVFGGVLWDEVDMILPDLEQIEVVRGPGATLWGTNAVNGVINIRTKSAEDTQGWLVSAGVGTELRTIGQVRYGGKLSEDSYFRVWTKYVNHDSGIDASGADRPDDFDALRGGFRADGSGGDTTWMVQGNAYYTNRLGGGSAIPQGTGHLATTVVAADMDAFNGNLLGQLQLDHGGGDWSELTAYFDTRDRSVLRGLKTQTHTLNTEYRRHIKGDRHEVLFGMGYRFDALQSQASPTLSFVPSNREIHQILGFIQDTISFEDARWSLLIGSKFEYNDFSGFEIQPSARLSFMPDESTIIWGAASRPVRTPSRTAQDLNLITSFVDTGLIGGGPPSGIFIPTVLSGNPGIKSEDLLSLELGMREQLKEGLVLDATAYYNNYSGVIAIPAGTITPLQTNNSGTIHTWGAEVALSWSPSDDLDLVASYSYYGFEFARSGSFSQNPPDSYPQHMAQLRASYDLMDGLNLNANTYVTEDSGGLAGSGYVRLDLGVTWEIDAKTKLSIWGQNLLDDGHVEAADSFLSDAPTEVQRGVYLTLTKEF